MNTKQETTPVMQLMNLVYKQSCTGVGHSWERINQSMRRALMLAIEAGFTFAEGDFASVWQMPNSGYWIGATPEMFYSSAVAGGNMSACQSYEAAKKRKPFIMDDVEHRECGGGGHGSPSRERDRVAVGSRTKWQGHRVRVTSFSGDGEYVTACSYKTVKTEGNKYASEKIDKRFKITHEAIQQARAEAKERASLLAKLNEKAGNDEAVAVKMTKALGCKRREEFERVPMDRVRKVVEKFCA